jgi:hypothetical protein
MPKSQQSIFDIAERKKTEGMEAAYRHADTRWKQAAVEYLKHLVETQKYITSEQVVMHLNGQGIVTGENRAIGSIMKAFERTGTITSTGRFAESVRPECHKSPVRIWQSNIYKEK